ncbi:MAG TPA: hypothetical protein VLK78_02445, partial [Candidatus Angelobacter sp.]|nr:hypothetical protein [Candidatus Angelobacter sp.]
PYKEVDLMLKVTFLIVCLSFLVGALYMQKKLHRFLDSNCYLWGLGADTVVDYTRKVTIENNQLSIIGWQRVATDQIIQYSVIKKKWGLFPVYYDSCEIKGAYTIDSPFHHTFYKLPNGAGYQVEICNFGDMSQGCFLIET